MHHVFQSPLGAVVRLSFEFSFLPLLSFRLFFELFACREDLLHADFILAHLQNTSGDFFRLQSWNHIR